MTEFSIRATLPQKVSRRSRSHNIPSGIKNMTLLILLQFTLTFVMGAADDLYNPDYTDEIGQLKLSADLIEFLRQGETGLRDNGNEMEKRHVGSVASLSGTREKYQRQLLTPELLKRHLGSVASSRPRQATYSNLEKRYLGSVASKAGFRSPTSISKSTGGDVSESRWFQENKRHVGAVAKTNAKPLNRVTRWHDLSEFRETANDSGESSQSELSESEPNDTWMDTAIEDSNEFEDEPIALKAKRFMGTLVRGGWFPRQFRGFVAETPLDKRHIGSAARMGWVPTSKQDLFGEGTGFKRNIQSYKKIQFAASPVSSWGWGRPREKRMTH